MRLSITQESLAGVDPTAGVRPPAPAMLQRERLANDRLQPVAGSRSAARKLSIIPSTVDAPAAPPVGKFDALRP